MEELAKRLRELRKERDLTLDMVVYDMNSKYNIEITKSNLSRWENGINDPSLHYARYLCQYYNVNLDYLIGNTNIRTPVNLLKFNRKPPLKKESPN